MISWDSFLYFAMPAIVLWVVAIVLILLYICTIRGRTVYDIEVFSAVCILNIVHTI